MTANSRRPPANLLDSGGSLLYGFAGLLLWVVSVTTADFSKMGPMGLVTVVGVPFFIGLALVAVSLTIEINRIGSSDTRLILLTLILVVYIFGTSSAIAPVASLGDSWLHAGITKYILSHGQVLNGYDARFSWPGGFTLGAVLVAFAGKVNALGFLRWFPLIIEMMYLAPVIVIVRYSGVHRKAGWLAVILFYATDWIYQDYFSPQALNYFFMLVVIALTLAFLQPIRDSIPTGIFGQAQRIIARISSPFSRSRALSYESVPVESSAVTLAVLGLAALLCLASALSHQLTPYAIILALSGAYLTRRLGRPELVVAAGLFTVGWLSIGATDFWLGHLSTIFGSVGQLSSTIGSNVTQRVTGSQSHRLIVNSRILITAALYIVAGIGVLVRRPYTRTLEALAAAPFLLVVAQSYGGEALLRVVLYGLPFTTLLAASAIMPHQSGIFNRYLARLRIGFRLRSVTRLIVVALIIFGFAAATFAVRGGNDAYESFSLGELAAVNYTYDHIFKGQTIGMVIPYLPLGQRDVGSVGYFLAADAGGTPTIPYVRSELLKIRPRFIILSASQYAWGRIVEGYPVGWQISLQHYLLAHGYIIVGNWRTATVLRLTSSTTG